MWLKLELRKKFGLCYFLKLELRKTKRLNCLNYANWKGITILNMVGQDFCRMIFNIYLNASREEVVNYFSPKVLQNYSGHLKLKQGH